MGNKIMFKGPLLTLFMQPGIYITMDYIIAYMYSYIAFLSNIWNSRTKKLLQLYEP